MGNASPFDAQARKDVQDCVDQTVLEFNKGYLIALAANLTKQIRKEKESAGAEDYKRQLLEDPDPPKSAQKEGWLTKQGAIRKNWKRRYCIIHPDYTFTYHEAPEAKDKPKGTINFRGYWVGDCREKPLTIEMYHSYRRKWYFTCDTEEEYKQWKEALGLCTRYAPPLMSTDDLLRKTYQNAYLKCWALYWGWSSRFYADGTEPEMLSDLMMRQVRWKVLWRIFQALKGPASVQNIARDQITTTVKASLDAAAAACWKATCEAREKIQPEMRKTIEEKGGPIFEAMAKFKADLKQKVLSAMEPLIEKGKPILQKVADLAYNPIAEAHIESFKTYKYAVDRLASDYKGDYSKTPELYWGSYWWLSRARNPLYDLQNNSAWKAVVRPPTSGTDDSGDKNSDENAETVNNIVWAISDPLTDQMKRALYTLSKDKNPGLVAKKLFVDSKQMLGEQLRTVMIGILLPNIMVPLRATIMPVLQEIDGLLPDTMKQFISIEELFEEIVSETVEAIVDRLLVETTPSVYERVMQAFNDVCSSMEGFNDPLESATKGMADVNLGATPSPAPTEEVAA